MRAHGLVYDRLGLLNVDETQFSHVSLLVCQDFFKLTLGHLVLFGLHLL